MGFSKKFKKATGLDKVKDALKGLSSSQIKKLADLRNLRDMGKISEKQLKKLAKLENLESLGVAEGALDDLEDFFDPTDELKEFTELTAETGQQLVEDAIEDVKTGDIEDILDPRDEIEQVLGTFEETGNFQIEEFLQDTFGDELGSLMHEMGMSGGNISPTSLADFENAGSEELFGEDGKVVDDLNDQIKDVLGDLEEELNTGFGNFEDAPLDETLEAFSGQTAAENAVQAAKDQVEFSRRALGLLREDLRPFREILSPEQMANVRDLATDPTTQQDFLSNNPLLNELASEIKSTSFASSGGMSTDDIINRTFAEQGNDLINQQINRVLPLLSAGQSSAAQSAIGSSNLLTGAGNAAAAGLMGQANAQAAGAQNVGSLVGLIASIFMSDSRLKDNPVKVGKHGDLDVYEWDWSRKAKEFGLKGKGRGHLAQDVLEKHPELVTEHSNGYLMIDYSTDKTVNYV